MSYSIEVDRANRCIMAYVVTKIFKFVHYFLNLSVKELSAFIALEVQKTTLGIKQIYGGNIRGSKGY